MFVDRHSFWRRGAAATVAFDPGPQIVSVGVTALGDTTVQISWTVSENVTGHLVWDTVSHLSGAVGDYAFTNYPKELSLTWATHRQDITGLTANTIYYLRAFGVDASNLPYTSDEVVFETTGGGPGPGPSGGGRYGAGYSGNTLSNTRCGGSGARGNPMGHSFVATQTANITGVMVFYMNQSGYGQGNPTVKVGIRADNNGIPSESWTGSTATFSNIGGTDVDHLFPLPNIPVVTGTRYHIVFENVSSSISTNDFSLDEFWAYQGSSQPYDGRMNPIAADKDNNVTYKTGGSWVIRAGHWGINQINYSNGQVSGISYMEVEYTNGAAYADFPIEVTGAIYARQRIVVPSGGLSVVGAGVRLSKLSGSSAALTIDLQNSGRTSLGSFTLPASTFPNGTASATEDSPDWGYGTFASTIALTAGTTCFLEYRTSTSSTFYIRGLRKAYGAYDSRTYPAGYGEVSQNSGSAWSGGTKIWGGGITTLNDFPYFLELEATQPES